MQEINKMAAAQVSAPISGSKRSPLEVGMERDTKDGPQIWGLSSRASAREAAAAAAAASVFMG